MAFNLNTSRKPEYKLNESLTNETIEMYGIPCKYLYSVKKNISDVFKDFSHLEIKDDVNFKQIYILPQDTTNWEGQFSFNQFGMYSQLTQRVFISKKTLIELYPEFDDPLIEITHIRSKMLNSLIVLPSGSLIEITNFSNLSEGINNLWSFGDSPSVYELSVKVYDVNLPDEGVTKIKDTITLEETGTPKTEENTIFEEEEDYDTNAIESFIDSVMSGSVKLDEISETGDDKGLKPNQNDSVFGSLG